MSQRALALAVRDKIRATLTVGDEACRFMLNGKPPAFAGKYFVSVHEGDWKPLTAEGSAEAFGVQVTVTYRTGDVPPDQLGEEALLLATAGLEPLLRRIRAALVTDLDASPSDLSVLNRANAYLQAGAGVGVAFNGFVEKLEFLDGGRTEPVNADWLSARSTAGGRIVADPAVRRTLTFGRASRYQHYESMDMESVP